MKKSELQKLIREEISKVLKEDFKDLQTDVDRELLSNFITAGEALIDDLYNLGGYRDSKYLKNYLKNIIDINL